MSAFSLNDVYRGILYALYRDAHNITFEELAEKVEFSPATVRNRINLKGEHGLINGYIPNGQANYPPHVSFVCTALVNERTELAKDAIVTIEVVDVRELPSRP